MSEPVMMFSNPITGWWRWYAWYPVRTLDRGWRWLCWIERRALVTKPNLPGPIGDPWHQHRVIP